MNAIKDRIALNYEMWDEYGEEEDLMVGKFIRLILIGDDVHVSTAIKERRGDSIEFFFETVPFDDFMEQDREEEDGIVFYSSFDILKEDFELLYAHAHRSYTYRMIKKVIEEFECNAM
jgi:hypothetical protein